MISLLFTPFYALQQGITHRDLKMSNVLLSSDGEPKLDDPAGPLSTLSYAGCDAEVRLVRVDGPEGSDLFWLVGGRVVDWGAVADADDVIARILPGARE